MFSYVFFMFSYVFFMFFYLCRVKNYEPGKHDALMCLKIERIEFDPHYTYKLSRLNSKYSSDFFLSLKKYKHTSYLPFCYVDES